MRTAKIISLINMKGGVGKTTLCKELANYTSLQEDNKVLIIDIDPQSNLTQALNERFDPKTKNEKAVPEVTSKIATGEAPEVNSEFVASIQNIFTTKSTGYDLSKIIVEFRPNLHIVPGELETIFIGRPSGGNNANKLMDFIKDNKLIEEYDYIFIDCPPTYSIYTEMAFFVSDYYLVPVIPDAYSALGVDLLERVVQDIIFANRNTVFVNRQPKNLGVILTRVDLKNKPQQQFFISALSQTDVVTQKNIYIFNKQFIEVNKLSTSMFDKLITDRNDRKLTSTIDDIYKEFILRLEELENERIADL